MRTLGEAFRSTFSPSDEWPRTALAGLGDQVSLDTPVSSIESGALWLLEEGESTALPTLLILTQDRLVVGQTATGRGGLRWLTLSSVERMDAVDDETTGARLRLELFLQGGLGLGVKCSDPFVESLVESLRRTAEERPDPADTDDDEPERDTAGELESRRRHPSRTPDTGATTRPTTGAAQLADAIGEVDDDPSQLADLDDTPLREGPVPNLAEPLESGDQTQAAGTGDDAEPPMFPSADPDVAGVPAAQGLFAPDQGSAETGTETTIEAATEAATELATEPGTESTPELPSAGGTEPTAEVAGETTAGAQPPAWTPPADWAPPQPPGAESLEGSPPPPPPMGGSIAEAPAPATDDVVEPPLPTRNKGRAYNVGLEAERNLTAAGSEADSVVPPAPQPAPIEPTPMTPEPMADLAEEATGPSATAEDAGSLLPAAPAPPPPLPSWHAPGASFTTAFDESDSTDGPGTDAVSDSEAPPATQGMGAIALGPATSEVPEVSTRITDSTPVVAPETEATPVVEVPAEAAAAPDDGSWVLDSPEPASPDAPTGATDAVSVPEMPEPVVAPAPETDPSKDAWTSWPTDAPNLATPAGYGDEEYDPSVDDFADLAAGATSFDDPDEAQPQPQPAMVGVSKANDGWWHTMPTWPDAFRSMSYLGGHPEMPKKRKNITMFFRPEGIRSEAGGFGSWKIELPWEQVVGMNVESSDELMFHTNMRIDLSSAALAIETEGGTLYFECRLRRPATVRSALAPILNAMGGNVG
ncbi:MAG: hypothetical protein R2704_02800 [Microthrixaceae bacterium]